MFTYNAFGYLKSAQVGAQVIDYILDGKNNRVGKKVNGILKQRFVYKAQGQVISEVNEAAQVRMFSYATHVNSPSAMVVGSERYYFVLDHVGSVLMVINTSTGAVVQELEYDAFGNVLKDTNPGFQPFGFAGGLYDHHTQLVRFGARDYDPETGRWTSKDPILFNGGDTNLYRYVANDPINFIDPEGTIPVPLILGVLAGVLYATDTDTPGAAQSEMIGVPMAVAGGWTAGGGVCKATNTSVQFRTYPNAGGGGVGLYRNAPLPGQSSNIIRFDLHRIPQGGQQVYRPHVDIPGVVKHWPWGK